MARRKNAAPTAGMSSQTYLDEQGYGGTKVQFALDDVANMVMPMPPLDEQATIVQFVDKPCNWRVHTRAEQRRA